MGEKFKFCFLDLSGTFFFFNVCLWFFESADMEPTGMESYTSSLTSLPSGNLLPLPLNIVDLSDSFLKNRV